MPVKSERNPGKGGRVSRNTTEHRLALEQLRHSEALYHSLVESLPQHIFRKDREGRFTFVNQRFCASVSRTMQEILGKTDFDFFPPELARKYQEDDQRVMSTGTIFETVEENQPPGLGRIVVHVVKIPVYDPAGGIQGIQGIYWDITEQKEAEEALKQTLADLKRSHEELKSAQQQLVQAAKFESVGTLAAGVAHEVKNPLQTILMGLDYLKGNPISSDETVRMVLDDMRDAVKRADAIVRGLLHFAAANQPDAREEEINAMLEQSLLLVKYELARATIQLRRDLAPGLPPVRVEKGKIEQVFINLFVNAIHAMPQGGELTVRTSCERWTGPAGSGPFADGEEVLVIDVLDTGEGIQEEDLSKIFDPFFTTKPTGAGTGLGLPVTKKIIELHGGTLDVKNRLCGGVHSRVCLPMRRHDEHAHEANPAHR